MTIVPTSDLKAAAATCARLTGKAAGILGGTHLAAGPGILTLTATNLDITTEVCLDGDGDATWTAVPSARILADVAARCPGDATILELVEGQLAVRSGRWKANIPAGPAADYEPWLPTPLQTEPSSIDGDQFLADVAHVLEVAASADAGRPMLRSVHLAPRDESEGGGMWLVTTDSYRLAVRHTADAIVAGPANLPSDAVEALTAAHAGGKVDLWVTANAVRFTTGQTTITSRLVEGEYPKWRHLIPDPAKAVGHLTVIDPGDLAAAVLRCGRLFGGDLGIVGLTLTADEVELSATAADVGTGAETVPVLWTGPDGFQLYCSAKRLADALGSADGGSVSTAVLDERKPMVWRPALDPESPNLHLLMPIVR